MARPRTEGHLNPDVGRPVLRLPPPAHVRDLVQHFWVPEWDLPEGEVHRALVLTYPASNLAVEPTGVAVYGPGTRIGHRDLSGRGWAVGAMLRPAATPLVIDDVRTIVDGHAALDDESTRRLFDDVSPLMDARHRDRHAAVVRLMSAWLAGRRDDAGGHTPDALAANRLLDLALGDEETLRLEDLADRLAMSPRSVQRLARKYVGVTPAAMIRRRRLQGAAQRVREGADLAGVAAELGYADQAHLTREFTQVLGFTPGEFRS